MLQPKRRMPTTSAQYGMWVAQQVDTQSPGYLTAEVIEFSGVLDTAALITSIQEVLDHCDTLHMRFEWAEDALWQSLYPTSTEVPLIDMGIHADPERMAQEWMQASLRVCCDVTSDPLYRTALLKLSPQRHWWFLQVHHIALDGFGYSLIQQAVAARYNARTADLTMPPLPDWSLDKVVAAEAHYKQTGRFDADKAFWHEHLQAVPAPARLTPPQALSDTPIRHMQVLERTQVDTLQNAACAGQTDWSAWMLAAIGLWLGRQSGQYHLTLGLPVMNRLGTPALGIPCVAMNIVPLSIHIRPDDSMQATAQDVARQLRLIRPHLYYRYGWIRGDLGLMESNKFLFNQAVNLMPFDRQVDFTGVSSQTWPVSGGPVKDLNATLIVRNGTWQLTLEANPNAYTSERLTELAGSLRDWLFSLAAHAPDAPLFPLLHDLPALSVCDGPLLAEPFTPVIPLFQQTAAQNPDRIAIEWSGKNLSYQCLLEQVTQLAALLVQHGAGEHSRVVVLMPRSPVAITAALAILWVGAVYVPLDPEGLPERTGNVLADATPDLVLTHSEWLPQAASWPVVLLDVDMLQSAPRSINTMAGAVPCYLPNPQDPAYLLYTSGSTGKPNGVLAGHGGLAHFVASTQEIYCVTPRDRVLQFAPLHFDASLEEIFITLCHGATLVLRDDEMLDSISAFASAVERMGITILDLPTAYWHVLAYALDADTAHQLSGLRLIIIGGEAALPERVARWCELLPTPVLLNTYGPTETSIIATTAQLCGPDTPWRVGDAVPIGLPRPGVQVFVMDERLYPVPAGTEGELVLCGDALALQYLNNPQLTRTRFVQLPCSGLRAYRTGDLVQLRDGQLYFLGRMDNQIKISGLRIDPLEIENLLLGESAVREAVVIPTQHRPGIWTLTAFVAGTNDIQVLRTKLAQWLPSPAIPDTWLILEHLPRTPNGKLDHQAMRQSAAKREGPVQAEGATPVECQVMQIWREVLGDIPLARESNFFDLGGKSLQAIQASSRLALALQRDVPVSMLFRHATVQALANALETPMAYRPPSQQDAFSPLLHLQSGDRTTPALFCLHPADGLAWSYLRLGQHLPHTTIHGLQIDLVQTRQAPDFDALVSSYVKRVQALQAKGPYQFLGWSLGGALAHGIAVRLAEQGERVRLLALMDSYPAQAWAAQPQPTLNNALQILLSVNGDFETARCPDEILSQRLLHPDSPFSSLGPEGLDVFVHQTLHQMKLFRASETPKYEGELLLFRASHNPAHIPTAATWLPLLRPGGLQCITLDCSHDGMSDPAPMSSIGTALAQHLA